MEPDHSPEMGDKVQSKRDLTAGDVQRMDSISTTKVADVNLGPTLQQMENTTTQPAQAQDSTSQRGISNAAADDNASENAQDIWNTVDVRDQADIEREVLAQARLLQKNKEDESDKKRIDKASTTRTKLQTKKHDLESQLGLRSIPAGKRQSIRDELDDIELKLEAAEADLEISEERLERREADFSLVAGKDASNDYSNKPKPGETEREFKIRTGLITPFSRIGTRPAQMADSDLASALLEAELEDELQGHNSAVDAGPQSHRELRKPGFAVSDGYPEAPAKKIDLSKLQPVRKRKAVGPAQLSSTRKLKTRKELDRKRAENSRTDTLMGMSDASAMDGSDVDHDAVESSTNSLVGSNGKRSAEHAAEEPSKRRRLSDDGDYKPAASPPGSPESEYNDDEAVEEEDEDEEQFEENEDGDIVPKSSGRRSKTTVHEKAATDDGDEAAYQRRLKTWIAARSQARRDEDAKNGVETKKDDRDEWLRPCPTAEDYVLGDDVTCPGDIWHALYNYQRTAVRWLSELHQSEVGGIVGDEMGLGKTIQVISFLASLHHSGKLNRPALIVCPTTVMQQWVNEFHTWWPAIRVSILHASGSGMTKRNKKRDSDTEDDMLRSSSSAKETKQQKAAKGIVNRVLKNGHVLIISYGGLETYGKLLTKIQWDYAVLDEGHKIKNPNTTVTILSKQLQTKNRIILTGTPIQNNMTELWSLFDFVYPMLLGSLISFKENFEIPIKEGNYANATNLQLITANKVAAMLKETISRHFLQRFKIDVANDLPAKSEQTLCVMLTKSQAQAVRRVLASPEIEECQSGRRNPLYGMDSYKKACNHPDLLDKDARERKGPRWGSIHDSGKMIITRELIYTWKKRGDKMLLFSQSKQMLEILEKMLKEAGDIKYLRMDGDTRIQDRHRIVDEFNGDPTIDVFLLTTKVGGQGLNLTSANGVIIFDPDWNPSTDMQARERVYRLGQKKPVSIFRLMCKGTIEEKIYQRQLYKQVISDKILKDSTLHSDFSPQDLKNLFSYSNETAAGQTETGDMYKHADRRIMPDKTDTRFTNARIEPGTGLDQIGAAHFKYARNVKDFGKKRKSAGISNDGTPSSAPAEETSATAPPAVGHGPTPPRSEDSPRDAKRQKQEAELASISDRISHIKGVASVTTETNEDEEEAADERRILDNIFARNGVHSVLSHNDIVNKPGLSGFDANDVRNAEMRAKLAEQVLKKNAEEAKKNAVGAVTWTGERGTVGRPEERAKRPVWRVGGASAASGSDASPSRGRAGWASARRPATKNSLFSRLSSSREATPPAAAPVTEADLKRQEFIRLIPEYIRRQVGGSAPSQMLMVHFDHMSRGYAKEFLGALREVAESVKGRGGQTRWVLKARYRGMRPVA